MNELQDIVNNALENPTPYKWALEFGAGTVFGAAYRTSKKIVGKDGEIPYDRELTSIGAGTLAEGSDQLRYIAGKSQLFEGSDLAMITGGIYTGQTAADREIDGKKENED